MPADFRSIFAAIKPVLASQSHRLSVKADTDGEYTLVTKSGSPFPQHKGEPLFFGSVRIGKAYVSFHLMPLYMCPELKGKIGPALKKRMQGKACFNFKAHPEREILAELMQLTAAAVERWEESRWL